MAVSALRGWPWPRATPYCLSMPGLQERARRIQGWAWRPKSCNIPHLDGAELDRLLLAGGHEVLYAGDSTTQHAFYD